MSIKHSISLLYFLISIVVCHAQYYLAYYDGPYIFEDKDSVSVKWIEGGELIDTTFKYDGEFPDINIFQRNNIPIKDIYTKKIKPKHKAQYKKASKIAAISDIHGQFQIMHRLFLANGIVDSQGNWAFGDGHLVITGDIFDRGPAVIDILWYLIRIEHQAEQAGGMVHVLLGNHEIMVLKSDLRYIHKKYRYTSAKLRTPYEKFFDDDTFLGRWVRSKPIYISIDDISFVHGGISRAFFETGLPITNLNKYYYENVIKSSIRDIDTEYVPSFLYYENGPLWYRGYAYEDEITEKQANFILKKLRKKHIVVGHTSMTNILSIFDNKIIFIDSSIKLGRGGEMLFFENDKFYTAGLDGVKQEL